MTSDIALAPDGIDAPSVAAAPEPPPESPSSDRAAKARDLFAGLTAKAKATLKPKRLVQSLLLPLLGIGVFLMLWAAVAPMVDTSLGTLPGPGAVLEAGGGLVDEWHADRAAEADFHAAQDARNDALIAEGRGSEIQTFSYQGRPTFVDQVWTSLTTVGFGFLIGSVIAIPIGLLSGLSRSFHAAINPLIQVMKPISPLAWLPIVTLIISATMKSADPFFEPSFIISALVVTLCSLWPTLINTAVGAGSVDKDLLNVSNVLRLGPGAKLRKVVLPSSIPYIFTGLRLSLGVGWMVLIAAEMLAQNPGLGKFVWDEFQNGSSRSLARIMFAVIVIGLIGFVLDRIMSVLQSAVSRNRTV